MPSLLQGHPFPFYTAASMLEFVVEFLIRTFLQVVEDEPRLDGLLQGDGC